MNSTFECVSLFCCSCPREKVEAEGEEEEAAEAGEVDEEDQGAEVVGEEEVEMTLEVVAGEAGVEEGKECDLIFCNYKCAVCGEVP